MVPDLGDRDPQVVAHTAQQRALVRAPARTDAAGYADGAVDGAVIARVRHQQVEISDGALGISTDQHATGPNV